METTLRTYIQKMADFAASVRYEALPQDVVDKVKVCIADALECCVSPMTDQRGEAALYSVRKDAPDHKATLFCTGHKASAEDAAYYNTVKGAITSRNDTGMAAMSHPGNVLVSTVLALAEENGASGKQVIEAIAVGYECMLRFGQLLHGRMDRAWRTTAVYGPVGAAFAAGKIAGLDADGIASAASFACHSCGGVNEWAITGTGEDVFQNAAGARNGIQAMRLAEGGAKGCPTILEGSAGIAAAFGVTDGFECLTRGLGETWLIHTVIHKPITSCILVQNPCQDVQLMLEENPQLAAADIDHVVIEVNKMSKEHYGCSNNERIDTLPNAIMSIPLGVAGTLIKGDCEKLNWIPPIAPDILDLMRRSVVVENEEYTKAGRSACTIRVFMKDGTVYSREKEKLTTMTDEQVWAKFRGTCAERVGADKAGEAGVLLEELEALADIRRIGELLA